MSLKIVKKKDKKKHLKDEFDVISLLKDTERENTQQTTKEECNKQYFHQFPDQRAAIIPSDG